MNCLACKVLIGRGNCIHCTAHAAGWKAGVRKVIRDLRAMGFTMVAEDLEAKNREVQR